MHDETTECKAVANSDFDLATDRELKCILYQIYHDLLESPGVSNNFWKFARSRGCWYLYHATKQGL